MYRILSSVFLLVLSVNSYAQPPHQDQRFKRGTLYTCEAGEEGGNSYLKVRLWLEVKNGKRNYSVITDLNDFGDQHHQIDKKAEVKMGSYAEMKEDPSTLGEIIQDVAEDKNLKPSQITLVTTVVYGEDSNVMIILQDKTGHHHVEIYAGYTGSAMGCK